MLKQPLLCSQKLQRQLEFLAVQEEYIKDEQRNLKKEYLHAQEEVKRIQSVPLVIGQFLEAVDQNTGIVGSTTGEMCVCVSCLLVRCVSFPNLLLLSHQPEHRCHYVTVQLVSGSI